MKMFLSLATTASLILSGVNICSRTALHSGQSRSQYVRHRPRHRPQSRQSLGTLPHFRLPLVDLRQRHRPEYPLQRRRSHHSARCHHSQSRPHQQNLPHRHSHGHHRQWQHHGFPPGYRRARGFLFSTIDGTIAGWNPAVGHASGGAPPSHTPSSCQDHRRLQLHRPHQRHRQRQALPLRRQLHQRPRRRLRQRLQQSQPAGNGDADPDRTSYEETSLHRRFFLATSSPSTSRPSATTSSSPSSSITKANPFETDGPGLGLRRHLQLLRQAPPPPRTRPLA